VNAAPTTAVKLSPTINFSLRPLRIAPDAIEVGIKRT
jgi:hypothetical protein